jgi:hypothetical protein
VADSSLHSVLDYILNRASPAEFEVIIKACERRRKDIGQYTRLGGMNPNTFATQLAASVNAGVDASLGSLRGTVRSYVERLIREHAPQAGEAEIAALLDYYVPDRGAAESQQVRGAAGDRSTGDRAARAAAGDRSAGDRAARAAAGDRSTGDRATRAAAGLPPPAVVMMVRDFMDFSLGSMLPSRQQELWEWMHDWKERYWSAFAPEIRTLVKARLEDRLDDERFWKALLSFLGL